MHPVTHLSRLAAAAAIGISLVACSSGSGSSSAKSVTTPAAGSSTTAGSPSTTTTPSADTSATPDAVTLIHEARAATKTAKSAHLSGSMIETGTSMKIDIKGTMDGSNQEFTFTEGGDHGNATVRTVGKVYYVKGDSAFWKANGAGAGAALLTDRWIKSSDDPAGAFAGMSIGALLSEAIGPTNMPDSELKKTTTRTTTYDGQPAYVVTEASTGDSITIAASTKYVLQLKSGTGTDSSGSLTITGWDQQPMLTAPAGAIALPAGA